MDAVTYAGNDLEVLADMPNYYSWIMEAFAPHVRGRVIEETREGGLEHIDTLSRKYLGIDYPHHYEGEERTVFRIKPDKVIYVNLLEAIPGVPPVSER